MRVLFGLIWLRGFEKGAFLGDNLLSLKNQPQEAHNMKPHSQGDEHPFQASEAQFLVICESFLQDQIMTLSEMEDYLQEEGPKLMRQFIQDRLNLISQRETSASRVIGPDKIKRQAKRRQSRQLESVYGTVVLSRLAYGKSGVASVHPLDAELNLPEVKYSYGLQRLVCSEAGLRSFDEALEQMEEVVAGHVPKRQAEQILQHASVDFDPYYAQTRAPMEEGEILVLSFDGKGVVMRPQDLKIPHSKRVKKGSRKSRRPFAKVTRDRKRMATVCAVYSIDRFARTPGMVAKSLYPSNKKEIRPKPIGKQLWASLEKSVQEMVEHAFAQASQRDPHKQKEWVALVDGNQNQITLLKRQFKKTGLKARIIVDLIHVLEYIWKAAAAFYGEDTVPAQTWVHEKLLKILQGKSSLMAAAMRRQATQRGLSGNQRLAVDKCANYLLNQKEHLRYDQYLSKGYPIATGVIEGACRYLVKDRMERTGARWRMLGAEAVLKMRALKTNDDFEQYWSFHQQQERNYGGLRKVFAGVTPKKKTAPKQGYDRDEAA